MNRTLLLIFGFLALVVASFVWFVATWDSSKEQPVSAMPRFIEGAIT